MEPGKVLSGRRKVVDLNWPASTTESAEERLNNSTALGYNVHVLTTLVPSVSQTPNSKKSKNKF